MERLKNVTSCKVCSTTFQEEEKKYECTDINKMEIK